MKIGQLSVVLRALRRSHARRVPSDPPRYAVAVGEMLAEYGEVVDPGLVDSMDRAVEAAEVFAREEVDVVVFAPHGCSSGLARSGDKRRERAGVVLGAQESGVVPDDYDTEMATARSLPVDW